MNFKIKFTITFLTLALFAVCVYGQKSVMKEQIDLFNGTSLTGWVADSNWFHVEDSCIVCGNLDEDIPYNMFITTKEKYNNFVLELDTKLLGPGDNSGIQFRSRRISGTPEVSGYQADMGGPIGDFGIVWGSIYDEARRNKMLVVANQKEIKNAYKTYEWNHIILKCNENHIQVWINGYNSADYIETDDSISKTGIIGFQIHKGAPTQVWFKNIKLTKI